MAVHVRLLLATIGLVAVGCVLYVAEWIGAAQLFWVFASGTAGAAVMATLGDS